VTVEQTAAALLAPGQVGSVAVACPAGTVVFGGGGSSTVDTATLTDSHPTGIPRDDGWRVNYRNDSGAFGQVSMVVYATCATV
jgi:hypothetical protein